MQRREDEVRAVYLGSNGDATMRLYKELSGRGPAGVVATNLFRACKASERAKVYRGGGYRGMAYDKKQWSMNNLCSTLAEHAETIGIAAWGWGYDAKATYYEHVLYVEIPTGQVSFHTSARGAGPDFGKDWDGIPGQSAERIIRWCAALLERQAVAA